MRLSITKMRAYLDCPRKYWYLYDVKVETPKSEGFFFGSAVHSGLEAYYTRKEPMEAVKYSLFGEKKSTKEEAKEGVDLYKLLTQARKIFDIYPIMAKKFKPLLVEHWFDVELVHPETQEKLPATFVGKIDLITADWEIVDHKTASSSSSDFFKKSNEFQATGYTYAFLKMFKKMPKSFIFNTIIKGNTKRNPSIEIKTLHPTTEDIYGFFDTCKSVLNSILEKRTENYIKTNHCKFCQFKNICPKG